MLETGKTWPQYPTLKAIADALGVPEATLFSGAPAPAPTPQEALEVIARELNRPRKDQSAGDPIVERIAKLTPAAKRQLGVMLDALELSAGESDDKLSQKDQKPPDQSK